MKGNAIRGSIAALVFLCAASPGCSNANKPDGTAAPVVAVLEPIPAPPGLVAEIVIPLPEATWKEARLAIGGPALFLPQSIGGFMTTALGLPITTSGEFDANLPALGAIIDAPERPQPYAAIGVHVRVGERLVDQLTKGEGARFTAKVDAKTGLTELSAKGNVKSPVAMGVLGNYLLVGRELADLTEAGPYIARTLAKSPPAAKEDIAVELPDAALRGPIKASMQRIRDSLRGSKAAVVPLLPLDNVADRLLEIVPDLARARLSIDLDGPAARLRVAGAPRPGAGPATAAIRSMSAGDVDPLRSLPKDTLLAVLDRMSIAVSAPATPADAERAMPDALAKLSKDDREALLAALSAVNAARGPVLSGGVSFASTGPLGYVRSSVSDEEKLTKALKDFVGLLKRPSIKEWLAGEGFSMKAGKAVIEGVSGDVSRVTIARVEEKDAKDPKGKATPAAKGAKTPADPKGAKGAPPEGEAPTSIDLFYSVRKEGLFATAGYGSKDGFSSLLAAASAPSGGFGGEPAIKAALDALTGDVGLVFVADPLRLIASRAGKPGAAESAPLVVALGHGGEAGVDELWLRVDVAITVIQELVKHRGALSF